MIKKTVFFLIIAACGFFLHTKGINWGIPDRERISLVFGDVETVHDMVEPMLSTHLEIRQMQVYYGATYASDYDTSRKMAVIVNNKKKNVSLEIINSMRSYLLRTYGADEQAVLASLSKMNPAKLDFNPHFFEYGGTYLYPMASFLKLCELCGLVSLKNDMRSYFFRPEEMGKLYTFSRLFGVLLFIPSAFVFFFLFLRITRDNKHAFVLTLLFVSVPGFTIWSHYLKPYTSGMLWVVCSLYFIFKYIDERANSSLVLSSIFAGFSMGSLLSYGYVFFSVVFSVIVTCQKPKSLLKNLLICFLCFIFSYLITNPYVILSFKEFIKEISYIQSYWKGSASLDNLGYFLLISLRYGLGTGIWTIFIFYLFISFGMPDKKVLVVLFSLLPALIYFGVSTGRWVHYSFIIYPYIFLIIAIGFSKINKNFSFLTAAIAFIWTFIFSFSYINLFSGENTRTLAGRWINENIPEKTGIGLLEAPSPWRIPPFQYLKYNMFIEGPEYNRAQYYVVSQYQWLRGNSLEKMEERFSKYELLKEFRKDAAFLKWKFIQSGNIPYDWCHPNPVILIWKKRT
ncbi:MAG: glycosyltransferase family 39 protein [Candidatus Omnitrophica bacterium]|nr:glycosyltransferase family 39 protein [Candidatus Omnitrophota bacterium]